MNKIIQPATCGLTYPHATYVNGRPIICVLPPHGPECEHTGTDADHDGTVPVWEVDPPIDWLLTVRRFGLDIANTLYP
jgi:hypothetical protein